jgi:RNA polymerase sigma-70 factor (ECF subfamily)
VGADPDRDDPVLVARLRQGDAGAFDDAYARFRPRIYGFLWRLSRDPEVAMDLVQDTFVALARNATKLAPDTNLAAWLFTVARNAHRSHRRWAALDAGRLVVLEDDLPVPGGGRGPDESVDAARARQRLERAIFSLGEAHREVLLLVAVEGMSHDQAAAILGTTPEATRQRLSRARAELASRMTKLEKRRP